MGFHWYFHKNDNQKSYCCFQIIYALWHIISTAFSFSSSHSATKIMYWNRHALFYSNIDAWASPNRIICYAICVQCIQSNIQLIHNYSFMKYSMLMCVCVCACPCRICAGLDWPVQCSVLCSFYFANWLCFPFYFRIVWPVQCLVNIFMRSINLILEF